MKLESALIVDEGGPRRTTSERQTPVQSRSSSARRGAASDGMITLELPHLGDCPGVVPKARELEIGHVAGDVDLHILGIDQHGPSKRRSALF